MRVFLEHPGLFEAAADHMAMITADRLYEFAGRERGIGVDLTEGKIKTFRAGVAALFRDAFLGDFCRVGDYVDGDEINVVISHGTLVSTMPIVEGVEQRVVSIRAMTHAVLRYSEYTGVLRMARIQKAHQAEVAELFAKVILERPGFFEGEDAEKLYTLDPVERAGVNFVFDHKYDAGIDKVLIIEAAADLTALRKKGYPRVVRTLRSRNLSGDALRDFRGTQVHFDGSWRLGELVFRILFKAEGKRQPQVTVVLRPPGLLKFRRTQHEDRVMTLIKRNGLFNERDDILVVDAAQ